MKITNKAKKILAEILAQNKMDTVVISVAKSGCCGGSINLDLADSKDCQNVKQVNGLNISVSAEDEKALDDITFDTEGQNIVIKSGKSSGCGCCDGCC